MLKVKINPLCSMYVSKIDKVTLGGAKMLNF